QQMPFSSKCLRISHALCVFPPSILPVFLDILAAIEYAEWRLFGGEIQSTTFGGCTCFEENSRSWLSPDYSRRSPSLRRRRNRHPNTNLPSARKART